MNNNNAFQKGINYCLILILTIVVAGCRNCNSEPTNDELNKFKEVIRRVNLDAFDGYSIAPLRRSGLMNFLMHDTKTSVSFSGYNPDDPTKLKIKRGSLEPSEFEKLQYLLSILDENELIALTHWGGNAYLYFKSGGICDKYVLGYTEADEQEAINSYHGNEYKSSVKIAESWYLFSSKSFLHNDEIY